MKNKYSVDKMYCLPEAGSLKAFADLLINDEVIIKGLRICEGKKGLFVSMPKEQSKDNKWYDQVTVKSAETFEEISSVVLKRFAEFK